VFHCRSQILQTQSKFSFRRFNDEDDDVAVGNERTLMYDVVRFNPLATSVFDNYASDDDNTGDLQPSFHTDKYGLI